jgi:5-methylthioadenosine/S-adenosylhomocysteine deaminase
VKDVYIAGRKVVAGGVVSTLDHRGAAERLTEAQRRMMARTPNRDYRGRSADEIAPPYAVGHVTSEATGRRRR